MIPVYRFRNRLSDNSLLEDDARETYDALQNGTYATSRTVGSVRNIGSKLFPFKYKTATQPKKASDHRLIALDTFEYLKGSGNVATAIEKGLVNMGYPANTPFEWVVTDTYQLLKHGIEPSSAALQCNDCHGGDARMDLIWDIGLKPLPLTFAHNVTAGRNT